MGSIGQRCDPLTAMRYKRACLQRWTRWPPLAPEGPDLSPPCPALAAPPAAARPPDSTERGPARAAPTPRTAQASRRYPGTRLRLQKNFDGVSQGAQLRLLRRKSGRRGRPASVASSVHTRVRGSPCSAGHTDTPDQHRQATQTGPTTGYRMVRWQDWRQAGSLPETAQRSAYTTSPRQPLPALHLSLPARTLLTSVPIRATTLEPSTHHGNNIVGYSQMQNDTTQTAAAQTHAHTLKPTTIPSALQRTSSARPHPTQCAPLLPQHLTQRRLHHRTRQLLPPTRALSVRSLRPRARQAALARPAALGVERGEPFDELLVAVAQAREKRRPEREYFLEAV